MSEPRPPVPVVACDEQRPRADQRIVCTYGWPVPTQLPRDDAPLRDGATPRIEIRLDAGLDASGGLRWYSLSWQGLPVAELPAAVERDGSWRPPYAVAQFETPDAPPVADPAMAAACAAARVFAVESHADETAAALGVDPVEWRLRHLRDARGVDLVRQTAQLAAWAPRAALPAAPTAGGRRTGRGIAVARGVDGAADAAVDEWSAWVAFVEVDTHSGDVSVTRVVVGCDAGGPARLDPVLGAAAVEFAQANAAIARLTTESRVDAFAATPVVTPVIDVLGSMQVRGGSKVPVSAGAGGRSDGDRVLLPAAAAIANAIFDATGLRLREPPFSPERLRHALTESLEARRGRRRWQAALLAGLAGLGGVLAAILPWRAPIAPVNPPDPGYFSAAAVERGRLVSAAGDCAVCHTVPDGVPYAGGRGIDTPFGVIFSTNITPDLKTGIGAWSYAAFERAMRSGIHRDGSHLYPAFPYTAYAKASDGDLLALYAYLMSRPSVRSTPPRTRLALPAGWRPLMAGWNLLFHGARAFEPDPDRSAAWNRGAYLVEGLGHCGGCHSPRNALGAERGGRQHLAGGFVDGWEAPALTAASQAPVAWTAEHFYDYLRVGHSPAHGAAAGPMAEVVRELRALPDQDLRAMATYLAALPPTAGVPAGAAAGSATAAGMGIAAGSPTASSALGARIYDGACAMCHEAGQGPPGYGIKVPLAPTTTLHAASPNNLIRVLLEGAPLPATPELGIMPAFHDSLDDAQLTQLVGYLRARFAPGQPAWRDLGETVSRLRARMVAP